LPHLAGHSMRTRIVCSARSSARLTDAPATELYLLVIGIRDETGALRLNSPQEIARAKRLTNGNGAELEPRFSPDGQMISYLAKADGDPLVGPERLHLLPSREGKGRSQPLFSVTLTATSEAIAGSSTISRSSLALAVASAGSFYRYSRGTSQLRDPDGALPDSTSGFSDHPRRAVDRLHSR
jgi:hypothetical protein